MVIVKLPNSTCSLLPLMDEGRKILKPGPRLFKYLTKKITSKINKCFPALQQLTATCVKTVVFILNLAQKPSFQLET